jgi:phenylpropionate dioxygenase-like ring-hydroxylating dioxygenase large terminal subunit
MERLWYRVWQMACFEHEITDVGDHLLYDIGDRAYIIMRAPDGNLHAYVNACLHRGRRLRETDGNVPELRCNYHGWSWNLDGSNKRIPCRWDFPHVTDEQVRLPEAKVEVWRGLVFINPDPEAGSLSDFLRGLDDVWIWPIERRVKAVHTRKVVALNWKAAQEAFMEAYHVTATHPQLIASNNDADAQYDASNEFNWNRMINLNGVASPAVAPYVTEQDIVDAYYDARDSAYAVLGSRDLQADESGIPQVAEGQGARAVLAEATRQQLAKVTGLDYSGYSEVEVLDTVQYSIFPNFHPWGGIKSNICYRWRPNGFDPDSCIFETFILVDPPVGGDMKPAPVYEVGEDQRFCEVPPLGLLGPIFDQDIDNMILVQRGMKATLKPGLTLGQYQESRIRHLHALLARWVGE